jgi:hypothetical protein
VTIWISALSRRRSDSRRCATRREDSQFTGKFLLYQRLAPGK